MGSNANEERTPRIYRKAKGQIVVEGKVNLDSILENQYLLSGIPSVLAVLISTVVRVQAIVVLDLLETFAVLADEYLLGGGAAYSAAQITSAAAYSAACFDIHPE